MTKNEVAAALLAANNAPYVPARISGCGRAYVCVTADAKTVTAVASACKTLGLRFDRKGFYGVGRNSIYIGYDNADGRALGKSEVFAKTLTSMGIPAYADAASD